MFERVGCVENAALLWVVNYSSGTQLPESGVRRRNFEVCCVIRGFFFCGKQGREPPNVAPLPPPSRRSALGKITVSQLDKKEKGPRRDARSARYASNRCGPAHCPVDSSNETRKNDRTREREATGPRHRIDSDALVVNRFLRRRGRVSSIRW